VVLDAPLMYESGIMSVFAWPIMVVACEEETQVSRLMARSRLDRDSAIQRIRCQLPLASKVCALIGNVTSAS
jgi:dephospho-CoA kinase